MIFILRQFLSCVLLIHSPKILRKPSKACFGRCKILKRFLYTAGIPKPCRNTAEPIRYIPEQRPVFFTELLPVHGFGIMKANVHALRCAVQDRLHIPIFRIDQLLHLLQMLL